MKYLEIGLKTAYQLQNAGGLVLICTKGGEGRYDLAPVAWCCPLDYDPVSRFLCVLDIGHKTYKDLEASREFAIALPTAAQKELITRCGSVSGFDVDKYQKFDIASFAGTRADLRIPVGVAGWIECRVSGIIVQGTSGIVMGDALHAEAVEEAWRQRFHYVSETVSFRPGILL
ncbi:MAG: flavin reductase family protein [Rectinemataceae bacterium]|nr:flavin reductase family protein [Rectinemataceae bacterium]